MLFDAAVVCYDVNFALKDLLGPPLAFAGTRAARSKGAGFVSEDAVLLTQARALEPRALATIHDTYYPALYRYILFKVGDRDASEDLTGEVFARLLAALHKGTAPETTLRGWLYGVASNVVADHRRAQYRHRHADLDESLASPAKGPAESAEDSLRREALLGAIGGLTADQQDVLALRYGSGLPIRDVAEHLGKTEGAVKQLLARSVTRLSKIMSPVLEGGE